MGCKNGLERRVWQFYTICDKNRLLKVKIEIDMAILVPRWLDFSWQVRLQMCLKVCMVKIANRTRAQTRSTITPVPHLEVLPSAQKGPHLIAEPDGFLNQIKNLIKRRSHSINFNIDTRQLLHMITFRPVHAQPRSRYLRLPNYSILVLICQ